MKNDQAIDFSKPYMDTKAALGDMHAAMLKREYDYAIQRAIDAVADLRMAIAAIRHEKEIQDALRQQTETV